MKTTFHQDSSTPYKTHIHINNCLTGHIQRKIDNSYLITLSESLPLETLEQIIPEIKTHIQSKSQFIYQCGCEVWGNDVANVCPVHGLPIMGQGT